MGRTTTDRPFWANNWTWISATILIVAVFSMFSLLDPIDHLIFHIFSRLTPATSQNQIALIHIGNTSGSPPDGISGNPRALLARLILTVKLGNPKIIAVTSPLFKPNQNSGLRALNNLREEYKSKNLKTWDKITINLKNKLNKYDAAEIDKVTLDNEQFYAHIVQEEDKLNYDNQLSQAIAESKYLDLKFSYMPGISQGIPHTPLPSSITKYALPSTIIKANPPSVYSLSLPLPIFIQHATAAGAYLAPPHTWSRYSGTPLAVRYHDAILPSLALIIAMQSLGTSPENVTYQNNIGLKLDEFLIRTGEGTKIHPHLYLAHNKRHYAFANYSGENIINGITNPLIFKDKILIIGINGLEPLASEVSGILTQNLIYSPKWSPYAQLVACTIIIIYLLALPARFNIKFTIVATSAFLVTVLILDFYVFKTANQWIPAANSIGLLVLGEFGFYLKRRLHNNLGILPISKGNLDNIRLLGIAFQSQGQLDLAYDRFRHLPINEESIELLYGLALDYERRRRFEKAKTIYELIASHHKHYRDVRERMKRTQTLTEITACPKNTTNTEVSVNNGTLILSHAGLQKPMLGRYEIDHEVGRGAMSIVYEGNDPKIGRRVAIKTLSLATEFQGDDLKHVKSRFYREAETAGQLNHPNIVTIYDAGEQDEIAYIAMEYLHGKNLTAFTNKNDLLPITTVLEIAAKCAQALDYAHKHQVIHRDIKPANIVYNIDTGEVKLTDFGIARITDASRTRTGVIMGTPSYMSPEQLAGRKLDGRSDLFSLGITCFQLLTGTLPFHAETMATLMFKITNEAHPALNALRGDLAPCVSPIINKSLQKYPEKRFQTGREFANHLLRCARSIKEISNESRQHI
ncbi:protein kinase domain-containing protein [Acidihalobacter aeolianus]|uniref:protein kinase domain-containing protein n=1 Tax=Acidihalobacter aeolianus TaxID=2792603 RepID=UPI0022B2278D|nr:protein kinase [Acidihalobacter aeolianus]